MSSVVKERQRIEPLDLWDCPFDDRRAVYLNALVSARDVRVMMRKMRMLNSLLACALIFVSGVAALSARQAGQDVRQTTTQDEVDRSGIKRAAGGASDNRDEPATRLEKFLARKNILVIKEVATVGMIPGQQGAEVKIEALRLSVVGEAAKAYGLSFTRSAQRANAGERQGLKEAVCFVDFDELGSLQSALDAIVKAANETSATGDAGTSAAASGDGAQGVSATEFVLNTRGGLRVGMLRAGRQQTGFIQIGEPSSEASIYFGIGALGRLRNLVAQARGNLVTLGAR